MTAEEFNEIGALWLRHPEPVRAIAWRLLTTRVLVWIGTEYKGLEALEMAFDCGQLVGFAGESEQQILDRLDRLIGYLDLIGQVAWSTRELIELELARAVDIRYCRVRAAKEVAQ